MSSEAPNAPSQEDSSAPAQQKSTSPLQDALKDIQQAVDNAKKNALFPCGGKIKVDASSPESPHEAPAASQTNAGEQVPKEDHKEGKVPNNSKKEDKKDAATKENAIGPIVIRYDLNADHIAAARRITLPINGTAIALQGLIATCSPATFGHDGKDVYDETYRKALKMDNTAFCTTFGPYSLGIIRIIEKMLLPSVDDQNGWNRTVRAELYKMNVSRF